MRRCSFLDLIHAKIMHILRSKYLQLCHYKQTRQILLPNLFLHNFSDRPPKAMPNPETPQNSLLDTVLAFREMRSSSTHQNTDKISPTQETITRYWSNPTQREQTPKLRGTTTFQSTERRPQTQKTKQNEKIENFQQ